VREVEQKKDAARESPNVSDAKKFSETEAAEQTRVLRANNLHEELPRLLASSTEDSPFDNDTLSAEDALRNMLLEAAQNEKNVSLNVESKDIKAAEQEIRAEDTILLGALHGDESAELESGAEIAGLVDVKKNESSGAKKSDEDDVLLEQAAVALNVHAQDLSGVLAQTAAAAAEIKTDATTNEKKFFEGDKPLINVFDARTSGAKADKNVGMSAKIDGNHAELSLSLSTTAKPQIAENTRAESGLESRFSSMLSQEIKNNASEFVKSGSIILKDNDSGSIRLILNPKDLGDVKIHLQLTDNNIAAKISVASREAYDAFKSSIDSLKQAFSDSGFSTGEFDLSWTGGGAQGNEGGNGEPSRQTFESVSAQYVSSIPDFNSVEEKSIMDTKNYAVNVMA
jgi:flagellar hook-length control protein FliK